MSNRHQKGNICERHGAFHVRYYVTEMRKGKLTRVLRSQKLCDKDSNEHRYPTSKAVKLIADRIMSKVNNEVQPTGD
ncbi:MAG TPA: hypothetical protein VEF05_01780, partial [Terriglobales bacterium]|nr:hypothetical protein [Terriglobales bacterium]